MFYVKSKINEETEIKTEITDENVFTVCPNCGIEHAVDLADILINNGDLYSTAVFCSDCSAKRIEKNNA